MSALPPIATAIADFRNGRCLLYPQSGHVWCNGACLLRDIADIPSYSINSSAMESGPDA